MDAETVNKLLEINRAFYSRFSSDFSDTRSSDRFNIEPFRAYLADGTRLLDAGCGNGRLAATLNKEGYAIDYMGIDGSAELLALAARHHTSLQRVRAEFRRVQLTTPGWSETLKDRAPFDIIVSLAVLHHIPNFELRAAILREVRTLLKPNGIFAMSNWQFTTSERLRSKIVAWDNVGLASSQVEPDDYLLDWKRGGVGYRYVHLLDRDEVRALAQQTDFQIVEQFYADNDLNLFSILQSPSCDQP